jgi:hypothetical protein
MSKELRIACSISRRNRSERVPIFEDSLSLSIARICSASAFES